MTSSIARRAWSDLNKGRIVLALSVSPLVPAILIGVLIIVPWGLYQSTDLWFLWGTGTSLAVIWSLLGGGFAVVRHGRKRGVIERFYCVWLGAALAFTVPPLHVAIWTTIVPSGETPGFRIAAIFMSTIVGFTFIPFGLLSGWVFWRIGVRPAQEPGLQAAAVFD